MLGLNHICGKAYMHCLSDFEPPGSTLNCMAKVVQASDNQLRLRSKTYQFEATDALS